MKKDGFVNSSKLYLCLPKTLRIANDFLAYWGMDYE